MKVKVGVVQDSPVFFDKQKTLDKLENIVVAHAAQGCQLLVFPESFVPGYPRGFDFGAKIGSRTADGKALYAQYHANSVSLDGKDIHRLIEISKTNGVYLVIGITEKQEQNGSLYCSMVYISPTDGLLGVHRKIKPTGTERVVWAEADGGSLVTFHTQIGKLGGLICWENYMPLARMAMYQKAVEIYIAPTADSRPEWTTTMQQIALEGRCFVLGCNQYFAKTMYPDKYQALLSDDPEEICPGGSIIVSPQGKIIAGPLFGEAGVLTAELDLQDVIKGKMDFDVTGHYARNDIFTFEVANQPDIKKEKNIP
ncbi:carbon-nitrogen hydrolase family protein [Flagellimonas nanhaiensis]|uniref:Carbon-nitrogen hydrolase family protein n=1 Tax=Flagellimonas nanhaiensis TaxID=2292706 RepID=A0A371JTT8_9FLAO|nr:carbon-nitrogen hydrolase family protein [Allomuricauda nanhaiensis]RDY61196.1 carbon-nitrogen hydrolase family protein [Allomuricauda nanhaiensis]